ncbi:myb-like protein J [Aplysia californica]|uniref:Myb-like protein J n=1 Tax=Aplysia californica TaxID=6500 RepID=A0ABM0JWA2_APLCA|nr:myb-like protein J [Aplysia californica]
MDAIRAWSSLAVVFFLTVRTPCVQSCDIHFDLEGPSLLLLAGDNASLLCDATCFGDAENTDVIWRNDNGQIIGSTPNSLFTVSYYRGLRNRLLILRASSDVTGTYICSVMRRGSVISQRWKSIIVYGGEDSDNSEDNSLLTNTGPRRGDLRPHPEFWFRYRPVRSARTHAHIHKRQVAMEPTTAATAATARTAAASSGASERPGTSTGTQDTSRRYPNTSPLTITPSRKRVTSTGRPMTSYRTTTTTTSARPRMTSWTSSISTAGPGWLTDRGTQTYPPMPQTTTLSRSTTKPSETMTTTITKTTVSMTPKVVPTQRTSTAKAESVWRSTTVKAYGSNNNIGSSSSGNNNNNNNNDNNNNNNNSNNNNNNSNNNGNKVTDTSTSDSKTGQSHGDHTDCPSPEGPTTDFGRHGVLAFSISLAIAFLLLYAILMIIFVPRIMSRRMKMDKKNRRKQSPEIPGMFTSLTGHSDLASDPGILLTAPEKGTATPCAIEVVDEKDKGEDRPSSDLDNKVSTFLLRQASQKGTENDSNSNYETQQNNMAEIEKTATEKNEQTSRPNETTPTEQTTPIETTPTNETTTTKQTTPIETTPTNETTPTGEAVLDKSPESTANDDVKNAMSDVEATSVV